MPCMSTPFMLRWAPHVKHAFLGIECTEYPGITAFMAAAACLGKARIMFPNQYLRNDSFARSTSIKVYCCDKGSQHLFGQLWDAAELSSNMATLWLNLSFSEQLEARLLTLICTSSLKWVTTDAYKVPELQSTVVLMPQVELHIYMVASSYSPMSLALLRLQSSSKVYMHIRLSRQTPSQAQQAVLELQTLRNYVLHIQTRYSHISAELQHIWGQLKSCKFLHLAFQSQTGAVHALPICKRVLAQ